jgi:hypothetical protein
MATTDLDLETAMAALETLEELIARQRAKVHAAARRLRPGLTDADLANLHAFPDVHQDPTFEFEDGQLAGLLAARIALHARLLGEGVAQG